MLLELPGPDDEPWGYNPIFSFSSKAFVQMFALANHDEMLLYDLSLFPMTDFLDSQYAHFPMYKYLGSLFNWIHRQVCNLFLFENAYLMI